MYLSSAPRYPVAPRGARVGQITLTRAGLHKNNFMNVGQAGISAMDLALPPDCHPKIRALYEYWAGRRQDRAMPARADLDPIDIPSLLPFVFLIDVRDGDPPQLTYRVFGTGLVELFGYDFTRQEVGKGTMPEHLPEVLARYARVIRERAPYYHRALLRDRLNDYTEVDRIILPLSGGGARVDQMIGMTIPIGARTRRRR